MSHLANIVSQAQSMLAAVLRHGDLAVDLTAGNGSDTLFLAQAVGPSGRVLAFDIQDQALAATAGRLQQAGIAVHLGTNTHRPSGVVLIAAGHQALSAYLVDAPMGIIANLGYLPGGDQTIVTRPETTLAGLRQAVELLAVGGRLAVVVYPGHPGGVQEGAAVDSFFAELPLKSWNVLRIAVPNSSAAPYLLVAEKR